MSEFVVRGHWSLLGMKPGKVSLVMGACTSPSMVSSEGPAEKGCRSDAWRCPGLCLVFYPPVHVKRKGLTTNVCVLVIQLRLALSVPWTVAHQTPWSRGSSRQEHWSGLLFSSPGDLPNPGIERRSPALQVNSLPCEPPGKSDNYGVYL